MIFRAWVALVLCLSSAAWAEQVEEIVHLQVEAADIYERTHRQSIVVTVFRDSTRVGSPFLVLSHGRAASAAGRAALGRARYTPNSSYFVAKGFAVFVPTRIGYGISDGPDVEASGSCERREFRPVFEAGAAQVLAVIQYAQAQSYVDPARGLLVGQSMGGAITLALAAKNIPGIRGAINFAGGGGGNPERAPEMPCSERTLRRVLAEYGRTSRIPSLWLYSENDRYWGRENPRAWFEGFRTKGGTAQFVQLPAFKTDGHSSFTGNSSAWRPAVEKFLLSLDLVK
jgi:dienelactone hydrolase